MNKLERFWRHLVTTRASGQRAFPRKVLDEIQKTIAQGESLHRAEVRMIIEPSLPLGDILDGMHPRARARELFSDYRLWDTEENSGVLIYLDLADHQVEIVADRGVGRLVQAGEWQAICDTMIRELQRGAYRDGAIAALEQLNALLQMKLPANGQRPNQLSDKPIIL
ncbi:TPM domain-containing protein|uniref:TPM domain-containing protein n=1 Tax=Noviherbaspirillum sp. L7-7A TaxID=2850560 RepID=UPI001C2C40E7|nr:TPM domain-containing protein [Noviherbaspirillum sp. L7-7A]MBV0878097.1 TPM domain-containing protein [Noviherbaspirillum sp. L7-7A]